MGTQKKQINPEEIAEPRRRQEGMMAETTGRATRPQAEDERREHRRYEIARDVLASMYGATTSHSEADHYRWADPDSINRQVYARAAVDAADALLVALDTERA